MRKAVLPLALLLAVITCGGQKERPAEVAPAPLQSPPNRTYYPTKAWQTATPSSLGINEPMFKEAVSLAFERAGDDENRKGYKTEGLVVIHKGKLIHEQYAGDYNAEKPHLTWSVTKSFTNALYGVAIQEGRLSLDDKGSQYFEPLQRNNHEGITIRDMLRMSSGIRWNEGYEASPLKSSVLAMLYTKGRQDMGRFTALQDQEYPPGTRWQYSSGETNLLMRILQTRLTTEEYANYPWTALFDKIGMTSVTWERDGADNFVGSSYLYATPRDLAKFGFLYLNNGQWEGKKLFPDGWVSFSAQLAPAVSLTDLAPEDQTDNGAAHWWANVGVASKGYPKPLPDVSDDLFMAVGHWGQRIYIIPSEDLVVVRVGDDRDSENKFPHNDFLKLLVESLPEVSR